MKSELHPKPLYVQGGKERGREGREAERREGEEREEEGEGGRKGGEIVQL